MDTPVTSEAGRPASALVTAARYAGSATVIPVLRYSTTTSALSRPNALAAAPASRWLWLLGGVKLFPDDSLPNTWVPHTPANTMAIAAITRVSRRRR